MSILVSITKWSVSLICFVAAGLLTYKSVEQLREMDEKEEMREVGEDYATRLMVIGIIYLVLNLLIYLLGGYK